jgi:hypothetical protein
MVDRVRERRPDFWTIRHEERFNSGTPDISLTGNGGTSWWEVKYANPDVRGPGIQKFVLNRLAKAGYARYVIFAERKGVRSTRIVHPRHLDAWVETYEWLVPGFDVEAALTEILARHDHHFGSK